VLLVQAANRLVRVWSMVTVWAVIVRVSEKGVVNASRAARLLNPA